MYKTKPKVLEFVKLKLPFLPGKRKTKHTQLNYKQTIFVRNEISMKQHLLVGALTKKSKFTKPFTFHFYCYLPLFYHDYYHYFYVVQISGFVDKIIRTKNSLPKKTITLYNETPLENFLSRLLVATTAASIAKKNRCFIILVLFVFLPLCLFVLFKLILVQFFLIFLLILVVLTELIYANYIIIRIRLVSSVEQTQMRASIQGGRRIGCFDLN